MNDNDNRGILKLKGNLRSCLQPRPIVIVSCQGNNGKPNALPIAYCCNCSYDPPMIMIGIVPKRYSHSLIIETGCFVVNLICEANKELVNYLGSHSGREEEKLINTNTKLSEAVKVKAPIIDECPVNIECSVINSFIYGSHEMFVSKVEYVHAEKQFLDDKRNVISIYKNCGLDFSF